MDLPLLPRPLDRATCDEDSLEIDCQSVTEPGLHSVLIRLDSGNLKHLLSHPLRRDS